MLLLGCLVLGWIVRQLGKAPPDLAPRLNWWVLNIALPALVLDLIPSVKMDTHLWFMPVAMWLVFLGGWAFAALVGRALGWSNSRIGATALATVVGWGATQIVTTIQDENVARDPVSWSVERCSMTLPRESV